MKSHLDSKKSLFVFGVLTLLFLLVVIVLSVFDRQLITVAHASEGGSMDVCTLSFIGNTYDHSGTDLTAIQNNKSCYAVDAEFISHNYCDYRPTQSSLRIDAKGNHSPPALIR